MIKISYIAFLLICINIFSVLAQIKNVQGIVTRMEDGSPVAGVSVFVKGKTIGTITNQEGFFQLEMPQEEQLLVFSYVGMKTQEVSISGSSLVVQLENDISGIEEVIVVAYGSLLKKFFTGSAGIIQQEQIERFQAAEISKVLNGLTSGLLTTGGSGQPGESADIRIRGFSSFTDANPLIVLDGFPYEGKLSALSLSEIQSVSVLKDAIAAALYGSRASNGVIIITTKSGFQGPSELTLNIRYGFSGKGLPDYEKVSAAQYYELQWEGIKNSLIHNGFSEEEASKRARQQLVQVLGGYNAFNVPNDQIISSNGIIDPSAQLLWKDDWNDELFVQGKRKEITLSARGGSENTIYFLSGAILDDQGIIKASSLKRYSVRANLKSRLTRHIFGSMFISGSLSEQNFPVSSGTSLINPFIFAHRIAPIYPVYLYNQDGELQTDAEGNKQFDYGTGYGRARPFGSNLNPLGTTELDERLFKNDVFTLRSFIDIKILDGLTFKTSIGANHYTYTGLMHTNSKYGDGKNFNGRTIRESDRTFSYSSNQLLIFEKENDRHFLRALAGHENYDLKFNTLFAIRSGFPFPGLIELDAAAIGEGSGSLEDTYRLESYLGNFEYAYANRYFASFNIRTDGNSRFASDVRRGNFWGAGSAWIISSESFLQEYNWLDVLRLKSSYGQQGNDKIGSLYGYQGLFQTGINNVSYPGVLGNRLPTPELTWEKLSSLNIGADIELFKRMAVTLEYYIRRNKDLLFEKPLPPSTGFTSVDANIARLSNVGFDIEISGLLVNLSKLKLRTDLNVGHFKNKILELPQEFIISGNKRWEVGKSIYDFWIEDYAGVNAETGLSQWYYNVLKTDDNGNTIIENGKPVLTGERKKTSNYSQSDRYYAGSSIPDFFGGINNTLSFLGFDVSLLFTFAAGGKVLDQPYQWLMHSGLYGYNFHKDIMNRWTPENRDTDVPVINGDQLTNMRSTRFLINGGYLNFRNFLISYNIPPLILSGINMDAMRINLTAENVFLFTARKGLDSSQSLDGTIGMHYIPVRTVSVGFDIRF